MNKLPTITVIISAYNAENYVEKAVQSILNQTFVDFECVIYNDGSTDKTQEILEKLAIQDSRIILINKEQNEGFLGFIKNLNQAIQNAKGIYIARMDADDIAHQTRLEKQVQYLEQNPDVFLIGTSANHIDEKDHVIGKFSAIGNPNELQKAMQINNHIYNSTIMLRNEGPLFYREKCIGCEDYDFHLRLLSDGKKINNLTEVLLDYRILRSSLSRGKNFFEKWIFKQETKKFYRERLENGTDSYENFNPNHILNLLNPNINSPRNYVYQAIVMAFKNKEWSILRTLIRKLL